MYQPDRNRLLRWIRGWPLWLRPVALLLAMCEWVAWWVVFLFSRVRILHLAVLAVIVWLVVQLIGVAREARWANDLSAMVALESSSPTLRLKALEVFAKTGRPQRLDVADETFAGADLRGGRFANSKFVRVDFRKADFRGAELSRTRLVGSLLSGARLRGCRLDEARLDKTSLRDASFAGASLAGANLSGAILRGANLEKADLSYAWLSGADLRGVAFGPANATLILPQVLRAGAWNERTRFPDAIASALRQRGEVRRRGVILVQTAGSFISEDHVHQAPAVAGGKVTVFVLVLDDTDAESVTVEIDTVPPSDFHRSLHVPLSIDSIDGNQRQKGLHLFRVPDRPCRLRFHADAKCLIGEATVDVVSPPEYGQRLADFNARRARHSRRTGQTAEAGEEFPKLDS